MPITPTTTINPATMTANWTAGLQAPSNVQKLINKYNNPKAAFNANPAQAQASYQTGVARAIAANKYQNGMANANLNQASLNMTNYGGQNWSNAGTSKAYKYAAVAPALATAITAVKATVNAMPKGKGANNQARMIAWSNGMASYYGKIKP
jgi:hypothetical protein